ncbi:carboxypeptidase-like regulatory domain-containing protein [Maribacter cobaltidurans]|uniref:Uncharacterized protein n=1 Tax=Maribacter cobaltidurans TaxID=1178778 RepID=A0A223V0J2_9FLAO|nr:carboxypeptidase-like regulatory domain-containing protein [Maribacter cobaltidurans]ASV28802.1 hypothetical protein CJ263_00345 [Maribacter cobaltidurans]GGD74677.1 hypothetical protein GCM10011412_10460 [Maribacter cobaltidurans]
MKKLLLVLLVLPLISLAQQTGLKTIKGTVRDNSAPMSDVAVSTSITFNTAITDAKGSFSIEAQKGETIIFSHIGMQSVEILVEDITRILNITMYPKTEQLDEVTVTKQTRRLKSQKELEKEYDTNKFLIRTTHGIMDSESSGIVERVLTKDQLMPVDACILELLKSRFPGVLVKGDCITGDGAVFTRGSSSFLQGNSAIFDIDGQVFTNIPMWLSAFSIKRMSILVGSSATSKYGMPGSNGVVVINTLSAPKYDKDLVDQSKLRNNFYDNSAVTQQKLMEGAPDYLKELYASKNAEEAEAVFQNYLYNYSGSFYYLIDSYRYFMELKNKKFAESLVEQHFDRFNNNPLALKSLAYVYDSFQEYEKANELYLDVFVLRPNYGQSYFDLAESYRQIGDYQKALDLYTRYEYLLESGFMSDEQGTFSNLMGLEMNNLIALEGGNLMSKKNLRKYAMEDDFKGTRLVFEWADSEAEFELQFVHPENQYFKWNHTLTDNAERIYDEKKVGYSVTEQLIYDSFEGSWQVNVNYLGNKSLTPTYLKATIYHNYGKASQTAEIKVFKLMTKNVNQQLFTVSNGTNLVSN